MKTFARIENGAVAELFSTAADIRKLFHPSIEWVQASEGAQVGWLWDGNTMAPAPVAEPEIPPEVSMRQARLALLGAGLLDDVDAALNALTEPAKSAAKIEWEYSQTVQRHKGLVVQIGGALGLTEPQMDALFVTARTL